ncbi:MAG: sugar ABC transporter ATP-binding protein [Lachnospiraceae bacterium]|nr:sugar ABC transporter ATP-binding protein [Lachnospiraceae bacterium]
MDQDIILKAENIKKHFTGTYALKGVTVTLKKGEIHALVGENGAGKSTLMNIISGVFSADEGTISLGGKKVHFRNPNDAQMSGIGFVHQELALCQDLSVGNNIFIGHLPTNKGMIDNERLYSETRKILDQFGDSGKGIHPTAMVSTLSVAQQQMVEIAKALSSDCKVLIFDEPTSSLNEEEAKSLFEVIHELAGRGIGIFYISHKMDEIFNICNSITIMRDGSVIETAAVKDTNAEYVVSNMVGKELGNLYPEKSISRGKEVLKVEGLTRAPYFENVSFSTYQGEILGLCGLVGAGRTEIARAICGIDKRQAGEIYLQGQKIRISNCRDAASHGICYLTEDRKKDGLFLEMSLIENMIAPQIRAFEEHGFVSVKKAEETTKQYKGILNVKYSSASQNIGSLSGGNQQKLMLAKLLAMKPKILFLDEPTRGIDVGAKAEIHQLLRRLSDEGISVVVISSEMPETVGICDRVVVVNAGRVVGELSGQELTQSRIVSVISEFSERIVSSLV